MVKNSPNNAGDKRCRFDPWFRKIPWRKAWQPTAVFLPGESHGQKCLRGYKLIGLPRVRHDWNNLACMQARPCNEASINIPKLQNWKSFQAAEHIEALGG